MSDRIDIQSDGSESAETSLILAHGAGAGMDSDFMAFVATRIAARGFRVVRFDFPYMVQRRITGKRSPPNRMPVLLDSFRQVFNSLSGPVVVGGKSMGGRVASMLADELNASGLICFGYPFHPAGKPDQLRVENLRHLQTPALFIQGTRDRLGSHEEVSTYPLSSIIEMLWLEDGDHSFKPLKKSGFSQQQHWLRAVEVAVEWMSNLTRSE